MNRNLFLLALCQGLFLTNNVTFIAINGLVGLSLAGPQRAWMATLPVTAYVVGAAICTVLVAHTQQRLGRKRSFQLGLLVAAGSAGLCAWAVVLEQFWLLVMATMVAGYYSANASLYRFAAPELVAPSYREKAISLVLAGGIVGGIIGPNLANATNELLSVSYVGAYLSLIVVALLTHAYAPAEKIRTQGAMDFCVFVSVALSSFASGLLITTQGWYWINLASLLPLLLISAALIWLARTGAVRKNSVTGQVPQNQAD